MPDDVLILIDQQKAMEHPLWGPRNNRQAEANILRLLEAWRQRGGPIVHVKHDPTDPNSPFRPGQEGNDFLPLTAPLPGEVVVAKKVHSAFIGTDLTERLEQMGRPPLVICGVLLANSVEATVRVAANLGFAGTAAGRCLLVVRQARPDRPAMAGRGRASTDVGVAGGEYASVTTTDAILEAI